MRFLTFASGLVGGFLLLTGCQASSADEAADESNITADGYAFERDPFFSHPSLANQEVVWTTTSEGHRYRKPFRMHATDLTTVYLKVPRAQAEKIVDGTKLKPFGSEDFVVGQLLIVSYDRTDIGDEKSPGAYREAIVAFPATDGQDALDLANPMSALLPALNPKYPAVNGPLLLDDRQAVLAGRESGQYNKFLTKISYRRGESGRITSKFSDDAGVMLDIEIAEPTPADQTEAGGKLAAAMGGKAPFEAFLQQSQAARESGNPLVLTRINRRLEGSGFVEVPTYVKNTAPQLKVFGAQDRFSVRADSPVGVLAGAVPLAVSVTSDVSLLLAAPRDRSE